MTDRDKLGFLIRKAQRILSTKVVQRDWAYEVIVDFAKVNNRPVVTKASVIYARAMDDVKNTLAQLKLLRDLQYHMFFKSLVVVH